jgi:pimeloyl-ACP methyl ester carboxylesterase
MNPRHISLSDGERLAVWESGPQGAPACLFLHGFPENHRAWRHQIAHLESAYRCIAPDLRGYGASSKPADVAAYATPRLMGDVLELADALELERFTLLGHDWGGLLAWEVATAAPNRLEALVVANAPHPALFQHVLNTDPAQLAASAYINLLRDPAIDPMLAEHGLAPVLQQAFGDGALRAMERAELGALLQQWRDPATALAMVNWYRASSITLPAQTAPTSPPAPHPITTPTLVLWGEADTALLPANLDGLAQWAPNHTITRLPDIGHFSPWQAPDAVNQAITAFLRKNR